VRLRGERSAGGSGAAAAAAAAAATGELHRGESDRTR